MYADAGARFTSSSFSLADFKTARKQTTAPKMAFLLSIFYSDYRENSIENSDFLTRSDVDELEKNENSDGCDICKAIAERVKNLLKDEEIVKLIKKDVLELCSKLSKKDSKECKDFIDKHYETTIKVILALTPSEMCKDACPSPTNLMRKLFGMVMKESIF